MSKAVPACRATIKSRRARLYSGDPRKKGSTTSGAGSNEAAHALQGCVQYMSRDGGKRMDGRAWGTRWNVKVRAAAAARL